MPIPAEVGGCSHEPADKDACLHTALSLKADPDREQRDTIISDHDARGMTQGGSCSITSAEPLRAAPGGPGQVALALPAFL